MEKDKHDTEKDKHDTENKSYNTIKYFIHPIWCGFSKPPTREHIGSFSHHIVVQKWSLHYLDDHCHFP
jgi:hypothetical protein